MSAAPSSRARCALSPLLAVVLLLAGGCAGGVDSAVPEDARTTPFSLVPDHLAELPDGEYLRYSVHVLVFEIGEIVFETERRPAPEGELLAVRMTTTPKGLARAVSRYGGRALSWIRPDRMEPRRYTWNNPYRDPVLRRYDDFDLDAGRVEGLQIEGPEWRTASFESRSAQDPASLLVLLRVIDLKDGEAVQLDLIEGRRRRLATLRGRADETVPGPDEAPTPCRSFDVRVDEVEDGVLTGAEPEMDLRVWVRRESPRVLIAARGRMAGTGLRIRLEEVRVPPLGTAPVEAPATAGPGAAAAADDFGRRGPFCPSGAPLESARHAKRTDLR